jgi:hypothetical protein
MKKCFNALTPKESKKYQNNKVMEKIKNNFAELQ